MNFHAWNKQRAHFLKKLSEQCTHIPAASLLQWGILRAPIHTTYTRAKLIRPYVLYLSFASWRYVWSVPILNIRQKIHKNRSIKNRQKNRSDFRKNVRHIVKQGSYQSDTAESIEIFAVSSGSWTRTFRHLSVLNEACCQSRWLVSSFRIRDDVDVWRCEFQSRSRQQIICSVARACCVGQ